MKSTRFRIDHVDCSSCAMAIEDIAERQGGVRRAEVQPREQLLRVDHDEVFRPAPLVASLAERGYTVRPIVDA